MAPRQNAGKRSARIPEQGLALADKVSKSDLLEIAWDMAALLNDAGSCDDDESTAAKLIELLNNQRAETGRVKLK